MLKRPFGSISVPPILCWLWDAGMSTEIYMIFVCFFSYFWDWQTYGIVEHFNLLFLDFVHDSLYRCLIFYSPDYIGWALFLSISQFKNQFKEATGKKQNYDVNSMAITRTKIQSGNWLHKLVNYKNQNVKYKLSEYQIKNLIIHKINIFQAYVVYQPRINETFFFTKLKNHKTNKIQIIFLLELISTVFQMNIELPNMSSDE